MADFKFNFGASDEGACTDSNTKKETAEGPEIVKSSAEVTWNFCDKALDLENLHKKSYTFGGETLFTVATAAVEKRILEENKVSGVIKAINAHSDLVAGQYEGGLKVWECSLDLCEHLQDCKLRVEGLRVLELGCGAGLPGILAARLGAASVHFQDFNSEVLELYTMMNLSLNNFNSSTCKFFSGDWGSFASLAKEAGYQYDLILTSETIYCEQSYSKLLKVFSVLLAEKGCILVGAKCDYFGVGGSVASFVIYLQNNSNFKVETVKHIETGVPRKILQLTRE